MKLNDLKMNNPVPSCRFHSAVPSLEEGAQGEIGELVTVSPIPLPSQSGSRSGTLRGALVTLQLKQHRIISLPGCLGWTVTLSM